jgi:DNA gyrase subunit B
MTLNKIKIEKLEFPDNIRKRYGMYIGEGDNPDVIFREIVDNSIDELFASKTSDTIYIKIKNDFYIVGDNGRGIPLDKFKKNENETSTYIAITELHAGSKFNKSNVSIGMNGVGASCTNALSEKFIVLSRYFNHYDLPDRLKKTLPKNKSKLFYELEFEYGKRISEKWIYEKDLEKKYDLKISKYNLNTIIIFKPDNKIFKSTKISDDYIENLKLSKYIFKTFYNKEIKIIINDNNEDTFEWLDYYNYKLRYTYKMKSKVNPQIDILILFRICDSLEEGGFYGSVNSLQVNSGLHINITQKAFNRAFEEYYEDHFRNKESAGLEFFTIFLLNEPSFSSQTKERLSEIPDLNKDDLIEKLKDKFIEIIDKNKKEFNSHYKRILELLVSLENASKIQILKSSIGISSNERNYEQFVPLKLKDCYTEDRSKAELFIVEGESAGGTLLQCRNPEIHAVLPLRGKILNTSKLEIDQAINNAEVMDIINAIGAGVNDYKYTSNMRYNKIIIVPDADPDGKSIVSLVLGLFLVHLTFLIEEGYLYIAKVPLYYQNGKFIFDEKDLDKSKPFQRFKGLGEMNPDQLSYFTIDTKHRKLVRVEYDDYDEPYYLLTTSWGKRELLEQYNIISNKYLTMKEVMKYERRNIKNNKRVI